MDKIDSYTTIHPIVVLEWKVLTSAIIIWQSNVPLFPGVAGFATCDRIFVTTGAPKVILGTKCPSMMSTCSQSAPRSMVIAHSEPSWAKSALRMEGAIMAGGLILLLLWGGVELERGRVEKLTD